MVPSLASGTVLTRSGAFLGRWLDWAWRLFCSVPFAIALIFLTAAGAMLGALISQVLPGMANEPLAYQDWLAFIRPRYGFLTDIFSELGLFNVYNTFWFRTTLTLLAVSIVVCTINRFPKLWRSLQQPRIRQADHYFQNSRHRQAFVAPGAEANLPRVLRRLHFKVVTEQHGEATYLYADRFGWLRLATFITHGGLLVILLGGMVSYLTAFETNLIIPDGTSVPLYPVMHPDQLQVHNDNFTVEWYEGGTPKDFYSDLVFFQGGREVKRGRIRVNEPMDYNGYRFYQSFYGPAISLEVRDADGTLLLSEKTAVTRNIAGIPLESYAIPTKDFWVLAALVSRQGDGGTRLGLLGLRGESLKDPLFTLSLGPGETKTAQGVQFSFAGEQEYTGILVRKDPSAEVVFAGSWVFLVGACVTLFFPRRRRLWAKIQGGDVLLAGVADRGVDWPEELRKIAEATRQKEPSAPELSRV